MLNRNGKIFFRAYTESGDRSFKEIGGSVVTCAASVTAYEGLRLGTGDTSVTPEDYHMDTESNALTAISHNVTYGDDWNDNFIATYVSTFKNNTANTVTIKEVGAFYYNNYTVQPNPFMIARQVISPREVAPGETVTFTMSVG